ncbi:MAG: hypothetical protein ABS919_15255, partial [Enterococcus casseliflavus]
KNLSKRKINAGTCPSVSDGRQSTDVFVLCLFFYKILELVNFFKTVKDIAHPTNKSSSQLQTRF